MVAAETQTKYTVRIKHDQDCDNPNEWAGSWKLHSFSRKHINFTHPDEFFNQSAKASRQLARKLEKGLAFILSYYEHGNCVWSVKGTGPQCPWDNVEVAGIAIWNEPASNMGAKTYDQRQADCARFLEVYTDWCNGNCYGYVIEDAEGNQVDSCWGYIGNDVVDAVKLALPDDATAENTEIECDWVCSDELFHKATS